MVVYYIYRTCYKSSIGFGILGNCMKLNMSSRLYIRVEKFTPKSYKIKNGVPQASGLGLKFKSYVLNYIVILAYYSHLKTPIIITLSLHVTEMNKFTQNLVHLNCKNQTIKT